MANLLLQVTIPASGKAPLSTGLPSNTGGQGIGVAPPQVGNIYVQQLQIQNNSAGAIRYGDFSVSTTRGILLAAGTPGGAGNLGAFINYGLYLSDVWVAGAAGLVIDVFYIQ
jgi:hypothetical protein